MRQYTSVQRETQNAQGLLQQTAFFRCIWRSAVGENFEGIRAARMDC